MQVMRPGLKRFLFVIAIMAVVMALFLYMTSLIGSRIIVKQANVQNGELALDNQFTDNTVMQLNGEWEFFEGKLLESRDFRDQSNTLLERQISILPNPWSGQRDSLTAMPPFGAATYRLVITNTVPGKTYAFNMMETGSSHRVIVDGTQIASNGTVSDRPETYKPETRPTTGMITATSNKMEVIIQVANFTKNFGGLPLPVSFGSSSTISSYREKMLFRDAFFMIGTLIIAAYHFLLYLIMRRNRSSLYFAIFCLLVAIKSSLSEMQLGYQIFPGFPMEIGLPLSFLLVTLQLPAFVLYINQVYENRIPRQFRYAVIGAAGIQASMFFILPIHSFQSTYWVYEVLIILSGLFLLYFIFRQLPIRKIGTEYILAGTFIVFCSAVNDTLHHNFIINTGYYMNLGLFIFIFLQAAVVAKQYSNAFSRVEELSVELEERVRQRTSQLEEEKTKLERLSRLDYMTEVYNKRYLLERLHAEVEAYRRYRSIFSVLIVDIDHFKDINDKLGHLTGDRVIELFARVIMGLVRATDIVGRFGGEEFLIVLRETNLSQAKLAAEKIRKMISEEPYETEFGIVYLTASIGISMITDQTESADHVIHQADKALYHAKKTGRNRVCVFTQDIKEQGEEDA